MNLNSKMDFNQEKMSNIFLTDKTKNPEASKQGLHPQSYWLTRFFILRLLGAVYTIAFLVAVNQLKPLAGSHGLLPMDLYIDQIRSALGSTGAAFLRLPSLFWFWHSDTALMTLSWTGLVLSIVVLAGFANIPILTILWMLYMSIVHLGQEWYGYGWEIQLLETGFLAIFLCPIWDARPFPKYAPPLAIIVLFRWLIFRIMFGAGLIKLRGDASWLNGTALNYFYETQPIPGPLTRWFHFLPRLVLKIGVWVNWLAELIAPFFVFWPRLARHTAGIIIVLFQLFLIFGGNLSFLNWLTIVPALACFDDGFWSAILPRILVQKATTAAAFASSPKPLHITTWAVAILIAALSIRPVLNMISPGQIMNTSFDPLDLVNTYGAFGSVGQERYNVIFEGTLDAQPDSTAKWEPYIYKGLPVALEKTPPQIAPYQLRLDWQMWFAAMASPDQYPWTLNLVWKLLHNDHQILKLFAENPFAARSPRFVRAVLYRYKLAKPGNAQGHYWERETMGNWLPPLSSDNPQLIELIKSQGWND